jgi:hypothetical protein
MVCSMYIGVCWLLVHPRLLLLPPPFRKIQLPGVEWMGQGQISGALASLALCALLCSMTYLH